MNNTKNTNMKNTESKFDKYLKKHPYPSNSGISEEEWKGNKYEEFMNKAPKKSNLPAGKRGRVKGQTSTISVIKDPILEPFIIKIEENQFVLVKVSGEKEETYGYYSTVGACLLKVAKTKTPQNKDVFTLKEFSNTYEKVSKEILDAIKL